MEDFDELEHLRNWIVLIRYRLDQISTNRLFAPTFEVNRVIQMIDREMQTWHDGE